MPYTRFDINSKATELFNKILCVNIAKTVSNCLTLYNKVQAKEEISLLQWDMYSHCNKDILRKNGIELHEIQKLNAVIKGVYLEKICNVKLRISPDSQNTIMDFIGMDHLSFKQEVGVDLSKYFAFEQELSGDHQCV